MLNKPKKNTQHTYEELQKIFRGLVAGYQAKKTLKIIAKELGIKESAVTQYAWQLRKLGVDLPSAPRVMQKKKSSKDAITDFVKQYNTENKIKTTNDKLDPVQLSLFPGEVRRLEVQQVTD